MAAFQGKDGHLLHGEECIRTQEIGAVVGHELSTIQSYGWSVLGEPMPGHSGHGSNSELQSITARDMSKGGSGQWYTRAHGPRPTAHVQLNSLDLTQKLQ